MNQKFYLYAETAFAHEGDKEYLFKLIDEAAKYHADGIKFQILLDPMESYTAEVLGSIPIKQWIFSKVEWEEIIIYAKKEKNLDVILLPIDFEAVKFCQENIELYNFLELHSINFNHKWILEEMNFINKPLILGIGGRTLGDIEYVLTKLNKAFEEKRIILMHGFQSFPTKKENLKLEKIKKVRDFFGVTTGYADHTSFSEDDIPLIQFAYLNGARVFEKHIVLNSGEKRTDYQAAVSPRHLEEIRKNLEDLILIQGGENALVLSDCEIKYRNREKKIVALDMVYAGEKLTRENIGFKVTDQTSILEQKDYEWLEGTVARKQIGKESTDLL